jgi:pyrroloquinoline quinone biosynthesis protein D
MTLPEVRLRLARKARLRFDEKSAKWLLLYPERGMALSETATDILRLCDGTRTSTEIVRELSTKYTDSLESDVRRDVLAFLGSMRQRGLIEDVPAEDAS